MTKNRGVLAIGVAVLLAIVANTVLAVDNSERLHRAQRANCRQIEVVKTDLRLTLQEAQNFATSSPVRSRAEKQQATTFYGDALRRLKPRRC